MHQSIPAAPNPPTPFCISRGSGICQPQGQPKTCDTHAVSCQNINTQRISLEKQADWLICQGQEKIEEDCKGMFSILCMHFLNTYQPELHSEIGSYRCESMFFGH